MALGEVHMTAPMTAGNQISPAEPAASEIHTGLLTAGGILAAIAASSCCIVPLVLFMLGVSGAWNGNLTALAPYQPIFIASGVGFVAAGFMRVYRRRGVVCAETICCATPASTRVAKLGLWVAAVSVTVAGVFPYLARLLLGA
jgi:mercuric ion transport protein